VNRARLYQTLAAFQAGDAVACAIPVPPIAKALNDLRVPPQLRWVMVAAKAASTVGLASVPRHPRLARLTTAMLTLYFVLALGAHLRVRDKAVNMVPAASFLALYAALTVQGPPVNR
jgi:hypothetical protein